MRSSSTAQAARSDNTYRFMRQSMYAAPASAVVRPALREVPNTGDQPGRPLTANNRRSEPAGVAARLMCSWETSEENIDHLLADLRNLIQVEISAAREIA